MNESSPYSTDDFSLVELTEGWTWGKGKGGRGDGGMGV